MDKHSIVCKKCEITVELTQLSDYDFFCTGCGSVYTNEAGVLNLALVDFYQAEYLGAKKAGMIKDNEGEYV